MHWATYSTVNCIENRFLLVFKMEQPQSDDDSDSVCVNVFWFSENLCSLTYSYQIEKMWQNKGKHINGIKT